MLHAQLLPGEIAIAVVGSSGCGKSTFISEDAKAHGAPDTETLFASPSRISPPVPFRCTLISYTHIHFMPSDCNLPRYTPH